MLWVGFVRDLCELKKEEEERKFESRAGVFIFVTTLPRQPNNVSLDCQDNLIMWASIAKST